jgi:D-tyrosyl-tRNA(Tyr) deacylase
MEGGMFSVAYKYIFMLKKHKSSKPIKSYGVPVD